MCFVRSIFELNINLGRGDRDIFPLSLGGIKDGGSKGHTGPDRSAGGHAHPAQKRKYPMVLLQDLGDRQPDVGVGAVGVEEQLPGDEALSLQSPHVDLLLAVRKRAVARIQTLLSHGDL